MSYKRLSDIDLISDLITDDNIEITHKFGWDRKVDEILEALDTLLGEHEEFMWSTRDSDYEKTQMVKHINKLEKMLNHRNVKFKTWDESY